MTPKYGCALGDHSSADRQLVEDGHGGCEAGGERDAVAVLELPQRHLERLPTRVPIAPVLDPAALVERGRGHDRRVQGVSRCAGRPPGDDRDRLGMQ